MVKEDSDDLNYFDQKYATWRVITKDITFAGSTTNAIGDYDGTGDPFNIFTVTGNVIVKIIGVCTTDVTSSTGTAHVSVGTTAHITGVLPSVTASGLATNEIWHDVSPDSGIEASSVLSEKIIANGADIIGTVTLENATAGVIKFICLWKPISLDGNVVAA